MTSLKLGPDPSTKAADVGDISFTERRCQLTVLSGLASGKSVEVDSPRFVVGKDASCNLVLGDATVSREHFFIEQRDGAYVIRDNQSTNGTWIDHFRIREAYLRPGVVVRAGQVQLRFEQLLMPLQIAPSAADTFGPLIGRSVRMRQIFTMLERVAKTDATVVILGETGTGKSAIAQALHAASPRASGPFITVDCGAIAESLIESELFGHEKGAFTGATSMRKGALERAQGGTLFIDELVDLRMDLQPRLLRVLEEREVQRVGGNEPIKLDVRVVAASRFDLWREVQAKRFREDLYFRLAVFTIPMPSLRDRKDDVPLLAQAFARSLPGGDKVLAKLTPSVLHRLAEHPFPGNVRELRNVIERAIHLDRDPIEMLGPLFVDNPFPPRSAMGVGVPATELGADTMNADATTEPLPPSPRPAGLAAGPIPSSAAPPIATTDPQPRSRSAGDALMVPRAGARDPLAAAAAPTPAIPARGATPAPVSLESGALPVDFSLPFKDAKEKLLDAFEAEYVRRLMLREGGNATEMARIAGVDRKTLYTLTKKHGLPLRKPD